MKNQPFRKREIAPAEEIKRFSSGADDPKPAQQPVPELDPEAPRHRRTQYLFNDYEHDLIYRAAKATDRSMQAFMRRAVIQEAKTTLGEE